jgi:hypothetical protein
MASGHVNRTNRPNTWLHRPACKREEKPCQLGAVHTWPILLQNSLMPSANSDSVVLMRFAAEAGDDGAAESRPRAAVLFIFP